MKPLNISKREKHILIITIAVISAMILYNFIFEGILKKWDSVNDDIALKERALTRNIKLLEHKDEIVNEYKIYSSSLRNMSKILSYLENQAQSFGVKVANIRPRPVDKEDTHSKVVIELEVEGSFDSISRFTKELLKSPIFITLDRFDLKSSYNDITKFKGILTLNKIII
ncbi:MAG: type 4a pilus biogenesis protein PilO [Candidatus Omnitrophota bacterium]